MDRVSNSDAAPRHDVARDVLDDLRGCSPDTGDDATQVMLDDLLDEIERRLTLLAESPS